jgi:hypothetical protein
VHAILGFIGVHVLLAATGAALLFALGLLEARPRAVLLALGATYLCGVALVLPVLILLVVVGVPVTFVTVVAVAVASGLGLAVLGVRLRRGGARAPLPPPEPARGPFERWAVRIGLGALAAYFVAGAFALPNLPTFWDDAHIWSFRALALYHFGELVPGVFLNQDLHGSTHLIYPLLQPLVESTIYHAIGRPDLRLIHVELWILLGSFVWTAAFLLAPGRRAIVWLPAVGVLGLATGTLPSIVLGNADVTVACFAAAGVLALGLWLESRRTAYVVLAGVLLAAAANAKNEGLAAALVALLVSGAVAIVVWRRTGLRDWALGFAVALAGVVPWQVWVASHDLESRDITPLGDSLDPSFLSDRADRLNLGAKAVAAQLARQDYWHLLVPLFLVIAGVCLALRLARRTAVFYVLTAAGSCAALLWVYWTSAYAEVTQHITDSVDRAVSTTIFIAAIGMAQLLTVLADRRIAPEEPSETALSGEPAGARMAAPSGREPAART